MRQEKALLTSFGFVFFVLVVCFMSTAGAAAASEETSKPVADVMITATGITWSPKIGNAQILLSVSKPDGTVFQKTFSADRDPYFELSSTFGQTIIDGSYTYELRVIPVVETDLPREAVTQTGYFMVRGGMIVMPNAPQETLAKPLCHCEEILDDLIVDGTLCVGDDCVNPYDCNVETLRLKEEDIRVLFKDTSTSAPTNDWQILINDKDSSGSGEYFTIQDKTGGKNPFTIKAGAPNNSLYIADNGKIGIGTSTPGFAVELKTPQGTPAHFLCDQTNKTRAILCAGNDYVFTGSKSNNDYRLIVNDCPVITLTTGMKVGIGLIEPSHLLHLNGGAYSDGNDWYPSSSRDVKENIENLTAAEAMEAVAALNPVKYNYKKNKEEARIGFIAEEVPELVAINGRKNVSSMDVVAVLTKVVQEQQKTISELNKRIDQLEKNSQQAN